MIIRRDPKIRFPNPDPARVPPGQFVTQQWPVLPPGNPNVDRRPGSSRRGEVETPPRGPGGVPRSAEPGERRSLRYALTRLDTTGREVRCGGPEVVRPTPAAGAYEQASGDGPRTCPSRISTGREPLRNDTEGCRSAEHAARARRDPHLTSEGSQWPAARLGREDEPGYGGQRYHIAGRPVEESAFRAGLKANAQGVGTGRTRSPAAGPRASAQFRRPSLPLAGAAARCCKRPGGLAQAHQSLIAGFTGLLHVRPGGDLSQGARASSRARSSSRSTSVDLFFEQDGRSELPLPGRPQVISSLERAKIFSSSAVWSAESWSSAASGQFHHFPSIPRARTNSTPGTQEAADAFVTGYPPPRSELSSPPDEVPPPQKVFVPQRPRESRARRASSGRAGALPSGAGLARTRRDRR